MASEGSSPMSPAPETESSRPAPEMESPDPSATEEKWGRTVGAIFCCLVPAGLAVYALVLRLSIARGGDPLDRGLGMGVLLAAVFPVAILATVLGILAFGFGWAGLQLELGGHAWWHVPLRLVPVTVSAVSLFVFVVSFG